MQCTWRSHSLVWNEAIYLFTELLDNSLEVSPVVLKSLFITWLWHLSEVLTTCHLPSPVPVTTFFGWILYSIMSFKAMTCNASCIVVRCVMKSKFCSYRPLFVFVKKVHAYYWWCWICWPWIIQTLTDKNYFLIEVLIKLVFFSELWLQSLVMTSQ